MMLLDVLNVLLFQKDTRESKMPTPINDKFSRKVTPKTQLMGALYFLWDKQGFSKQALKDLTSLNLTQKQISLIIDAANFNKVVE